MKRSVGEQCTRLTYTQTHIEQYWLQTADAEIVLVGL